MIEEEKDPEESLFKYEDEVKLLENLKSRKWRLSNLYYIRDVNGNKIKFKLTKTQEKLLDNLWYLNVILKARQLGITTEMCIIDLDDCLFGGLNCGFIAQTRDDVELIFKEKIKFAWDCLPEVIKKMFSVNADSSNELEFKNLSTGVVSSVSVGTSLRGHTFQRLHISELSTIDQKRPLESEEIKTGAFNTVHLGQVITVESTAKLNSGLFFEICQQAMDNEKLGRNGPMDWRFHFFPWWEDDKYRLIGDYYEIPQEMNKYFDALERDEWFKEHHPKGRLENDQKYWYFKKWTTQREKMKQEYPSTPQECFESSIEGAYFAREIEKVLKDGRLRDVPYNARFPVDTWWDLGTTTTRKDSMSVIFTQTIGPEIHIIDFYGCSGEGLPHMANVLKEKGYSYGRHWAPHDIETTEIGTGKTRLELAADLGIRFNVVPKLSFSDGIEAARVIMSKCWFDITKTSGNGANKSLFEALRSYRKDWDDGLGRWKDNPVKDWTSDPSDAFRMMAVGIRENNLLQDEELEEMRKFRETEKTEYDPLNIFS